MAKRILLLMMSVIIVITAAACKPDTDEDQSVIRSEDSAADSSGDNSDKKGAFRLDDLPDMSGDLLPFSNTRMERNRYWKEDLAYVKDQLPALHDDLFRNMSEEAFYSEIDDLSGNVGQLSDGQVRSQLNRILVSAGDASTYLSGEYDHGFPLRFCFFGEDIYVISANPAYQEMLYKKLLAIDGVEIQTVIEQVTPSTPHETQAQLRSRLPEYLWQAGLLYDLGMTQEERTAVFTVEKENGTVEYFTVPSIYARQHDTYDFEASAMIGHSYLRRYTYEVMEEHNALYFPYHSSGLMGDKPFVRFCGEMFDTMEEMLPEKMIIDLRSNQGGNDEFLSPFIEGLEQYRKIHTDMGVCILMGRNSAHSAIAGIYQIKEIAPDAVLIGEPTGGSGEDYTVLDWFELPNSGHIIVYTKERIAIESDALSGNKGEGCLLPDVTIEPSIADYRDNNDDVALRYALENM